MSSSMAARQGGEKVSSFAVTCNLLSQYIREKGRSLGDLGLGMAPIAKNETYRPPTTMSLLPGVDVLGGDTKEQVSDRNATKSMDLFPQRAGLGLHTPPAAATAAQNKETEFKKNQLTIFYGGKVLVFDDFPAEKARDLMMLAGKGCGGVTKNNNSSPSIVASAAPAEAKNLSSSKSVSVAINNTPAAPAAATAPRRPVQAVVSDLPIARKASLHRFLEKRKDRINAKAPYPLKQAKDFPVSVATPAIEERQPWLGLKPTPSSECGR